MSHTHHAGGVAGSLKIRGQRVANSLMRFAADWRHRRRRDRLTYQLVKAGVRDPRRAMASIRRQHGEWN